MKMYARKRMLVIVFACLVGFQQTIKAEDSYMWLKSAIILICMVNAKEIFNSCKELLFYSFEKGKDLYKNRTNTFGPESNNLKEAKTTFDGLFQKWSAKHDAVWIDSCYTKLPNLLDKQLNAFVANEEKLSCTYDDSTVFGGSLIVQDQDIKKAIIENIRSMSINNTELTLYRAACDDICVMMDRYGGIKKMSGHDFSKFTDYAFSSMVRGRQERRDHCLNLCCAFHLGEPDLANTIKWKYQNIQPSRIIIAFTAAKKIIKDIKQAKISAEIILPLCCDNQEHK